MLKELSYKSKFHLALAGFALLLITIYFLNIKKTVELRQTYSQLNNEYLTSQNTPIVLKNLKNKLVELNHILGSNYECSELPEELIKFSNLFSTNSNVTLVELTETKTFEKENMNFCTLSIILSGTYSDLVKYIYNLETKDKIGRISSVYFYTKKKRNRNKELLVEIFIQNIEIR
jgi:Tfp pilus assembly protein PilO